MNKFIPRILLLLIIGFIVIYERYYFKNHTLFQLISGATLGGVIAYISYKIVGMF